MRGSSVRGSGVRGFEVRGSGHLKGPVVLSHRLVLSR
jgi:hypothetical protein